MRYERRYVQFNNLVFDDVDMLGEVDNTSTSFKLSTTDYTNGHGSYTPFKKPFLYAKESTVTLQIHLRMRKLPCEQRPFYRDFAVEQLSAPGKLWAVQDNQLIWAFAVVTGYSESTVPILNSVDIDVDFLLYEGVWHKANEHTTFLQPYNICSYLECFDFRDSKECDCCKICVDDEMNHADLDYTETLSASGSIATFTTNLSAPLKDLTVDINAKQSGSGVPSPTNIRPITGWDAVEVTRCGKNILERVRSGGTTSQGITYSLGDDGAIIANGTATANSYCSYSYTNAATAVDATPFVGKTITASVRPQTDGVFLTMTYWKADGSYTSFSPQYVSDSQTYTVPDDAVGFRVLIRINTGTTVNNLAIYPQIEVGSTATAYESYTGITTSIPLPITVYGGSLDVGRGVLTVTHGYIASYNGETLPSTWISDRDVYAAGAVPTTGAQVVYELASPLTYSLSPTEISSLLGVNNVWANAGDVSLRYVKRIADNSPVWTNEIQQEECCCDCVDKSMALCHYINDLQQVYTQCSGEGFRIIEDCAKGNEYFADELPGQKMCSMCDGVIAGILYSNTSIPTEGVDISIHGQMHNPSIEINGNRNWIKGDYDGVLTVHSNGEVTYNAGCCEKDLSPDVWKIPSGMDYGWVINPRNNSVVIDLGVCCGVACAYFQVDALTI